MLIFSPMKGFVMKEKHRILAILLSLAMIITYMPAIAFAEGSESEPVDTTIEEPQETQSEVSLNEGEPTASFDANENDSDEDEGEKLEISKEQPLLEQIEEPSNESLTKGPGDNGKTVSSIEFITDDGKPIELIEGINGYYSDYGSGKFFCYWIHNGPEIFKNDRIIVTYTDNSVAAYINTYEASFVNENDMSDILQLGMSIQVDNGENGGQSYDNQWHVGESHFFTCTYNGQSDIYFTIPVIIVANPVESIYFYGSGRTGTSDDRIELIEGIDSYLLSYTEVPFQYYRYNFKQNDMLAVYYTDKDPEYYFFNERKWEFRTSDGKSLDTSKSQVAFFDDQLNNHWFPGNNYEASLTYSGKSTIVYFSIVNNPISSIEYKTAEGCGVAESDPIKLYNGYDGWSAMGEDGEKYFQYDYRKRDGDVFTIEYTDSSRDPDIYTYSKELEGFFDKDGNSIDEMPWFFSETLQYNNHWTIGETYTEEVLYKGKRTQVYLMPVENPVKDVAFSREGGVKLTEGADAVNSDGGDDSFFSAYNLQFVEGDTLTLTVQKEGYSVTTKETYVAIYDEEYDSVNKFVKSENGELNNNDIIYCNEIDINSDEQGPENEWQYGDGKNHWFTVSYLGVESEEIPVEMLPNPIKSFSFTRQGGVSLIENLDGVNSDGADSEYFEYELQFLPGDILTINTSDDYVRQYEAVADSGDNSYVDRFVRKTGSGLDQDDFIDAESIDIRSIPSQYYEPWYPDDGESHSFVLTYSGRHYDADVTLYGIKSIEFTPVEGTTTLSVADITTLYDGSEYEYYYDLWLRGVDEYFFADGDKLKINASSGIKTISREYTYSLVSEDEYGPFYAFKNSVYGGIADGVYPEPYTAVDEDGNPEFNEWGSPILEEADVGDNLVYIYGLGTHTTSPCVIKVVSDIESITYNSAGEIELSEANLDVDEEGYMRYAYDWIELVNTQETSKDSIRVKYKGDSRTYTYTAERDYEGAVPVPYFYCGSASGRHPVRLYLDNVYDEQSADVIWENGDHEVTFVIRGYEVNRPVSVVHTHDYISVEKLEATCERDGVEAHYECLGCNKLFVKNGNNYVETTAEALRIPAHHEYGELIPELPATCTTDGVAAHYECSVCHKLFVKEDNTYVEKNAISLIIPAGHTFDNPTYEWSADNTLVTASRECSICHEFETETVGVTTKVSKEPTCTEKGMTTYTSGAFTSTAFTRQRKVVEDIPALGHALRKIAEVPATCETDGHEKYWECDRCHKLYADEAGSEETTAEAVTISKLNHAWSPVTYEPTEEGFDPESGVETVTASRTCNNPSHNEAVDGSKTQTEIKTMTKQTNAASCTASGTVTYTVAFDNPAFGTWTTTRNVESVGHSWSEVSYTWNDDCSKVTATRTCTNPNHKEPEDGPKTETETVSATSEVTKPATCEAKGETTYTSTAFTNTAFAVQSKTVENVAPLGHDWDEPTYEWSEDNRTVTATRGCKRCDKTETETAGVSTEVTKAPTCTEKGETTYTPAAFRNEAFETQEPKILEDVEALGHDWDEGKITKRATASTAGEITYTCALCGAENPEKGVIAPLGHDPINQEAEAAIADADSKVETGTEEEIESALTEAQTAADAAVENAGEALKAAKQALDDAVTEQDIAAAQAAVNAAKQDVADANASQKKLAAVVAKSTAKKSAASAAAKQSAAAAQATAGTDAAVNAAQDAVNAANTAQREARDAVAAAEAAKAAVEAAGFGEGTNEYQAATDALTEANTALGEANNAVTAANTTLGTAVSARNAAIIAAQTPVEYFDLPVVKISKPKAGKKKITVKWKALKKDKKFKKILKKVSGVQIEVATDPGFSNIVVRTTANTKKASKVIKRLQPKTRYYVRIRAYGPSNHYSTNWKSKNAKVK